MRTTRSTATAATAKCDVLVVPLAEPAKRLKGVLAEIDEALGGLIASALKRREVSASVGSLTVIHSGDRIAAHRVAVVGVGTGDHDAWRAAGVATGRRARNLRAKAIAVAPPDGTDAATVAAFVTSLGVGNYRFERFKSSDRADAKPAIARVAVLGGAATKAELAAADRVAEAVNASRDLSNTPGNHLTPTALAEYAQTRAEATPGLTCEVLEEEHLLELGAGAFLSVAQGSAQPGKFIVLRYRPESPTTDEVLGLVGKGVTFDTGGISIKPAGGMEDMKMDMSGGATVIETVALIADLGLPVEVLGVVPATENMPGGRAVKPGDVVTAMNGKTIEIRNTDAEGRLILADALTWCARNGATRMVDIATLTGAVVVALGEVYAGLFGSDQAWTALVREAGERSGDLVWPMPLHPGYDPLIRSKVADLANASNKRQAGPVYAAQFLREFAEGLPWCHVDIAGTGMVGGQATGHGIRLLAAVAADLAAGGSA